MTVLLACLATGSVQAGEEEVPDLELLEFLGAWQTPDGDFLDPLLLAGEPDEVPATENYDDDD